MFDIYFLMTTYAIWALVTVNHFERWISGLYRRYPKASWQLYQSPFRLRWHRYDLPKVTAILCSLLYPGMALIISLHCLTIYTIEDLGRYVESPLAWLYYCNHDWIDVVRLL